MQNDINFFFQQPNIGACKNRAIKELSLTLGILESFWKNSSPIVRINVGFLKFKYSVGISSLNSVPLPEWILSSQAQIRSCDCNLMLRVGISLTKDLFLSWIQCSWISWYSWKSSEELMNKSNTGHSFKSLEEFSSIVRFDVGFLRLKCGVGLSIQFHRPNEQCLPRFKPMTSMLQLWRLLSGIPKTSVSHFQFIYYTHPFC